MKTEERAWSDDEMIAFAEWYKTWWGHPQIAENSIYALQVWKELRADELIADKAHESKI